MSSSNSKSSSANHLFTYSPLEACEFRLLTIVTAYDGIVTCTLEHAQLDEPPHYLALSYVWGHGTRDYELVLNGKLFYVTAHLLDALEAIKIVQLSTIGQGCRLWVDAICIDQNNPTEKAIQVPLINRIFAGAYLTVVWYGYPPDEEKTAIYALKWLDWNYKDIRHELNRACAAESMAVCEQELLTRGLTRVNLTALGELFNTVLDLDTRNPDIVRQHLEHTAAEQTLPDPTHDFWKRLLSFVNNEWYQRICAYSMAEKADGDP